MADRGDKWTRASRSEDDARVSSRTPTRRSDRPTKGSGSSGSSHARTSRQGDRTSARSASRSASRKRSVKAEAGGRYQEPSLSDSAQAPAADQPELVSVSVGELRKAEREERLRRSSRRYLMRIVIIVGVVVALLAGWAALYNSPAFTIESVQVNGVEHLTSDEVSQLVNVPEGTTLLRVDTDAIRDRLMKTAWIEDVEVKRVFPSTLEINVTERTIFAVVEIPTSSGSNVKKWAIAADHMWLMPIPDASTEAAKTTSAQIYEDAEAALHITDVPHGTKAEIGAICSDGNVNNALDIVAGMTTDLANHVVKVSAASTAETTLVLDSGVEIAFGSAEDIRDKERVINKILEENPSSVAYINVRMVETPTWRAV